MVPEQEQRLIEEAKHSAEAFGELYDCYFDVIFGYVLRRSADIDTAKDITSTVFLKALKNIGKYKWQGVPFSHWLYRIAGNEIIDHYKNRNREINTEPEAFTGDETSNGRNELRKYDEYLDLQNAIVKLSPKYQEVISLRYFEDLSIESIAGVLQKPEGTVKSLLHRAVQKLREMVRSQEFIDVE
jgi:RNA polymerase sigma-70 factor (ECF subfamily)